MTLNAKIDAAVLDEGLAEAHLPTLLMSLIHLTGDASLLTPERRAAYTPFVDFKDGGFSPQVQADIRARFKAAITAYAAGAPLPPQPSAATVRKMMDWVAGADIPDHYTPFLNEELKLDGVDAKAPVWSAPGLQDKAAAMKVLIIGAGMSGIATAVRLQQAGVPYLIVDSNAEAGGTWVLNTYPGCRVDNPNHMYSYSFEANHAFPNYYSPQPVLRDYLQGVAARHGLREHIRFETTVETAVYDEASGHWRVTVKTKDGGRETLEVNAVISAVGQLNQPRYPDIEGLETFDGPSFHSARWRHDVDLAGKTVAVIGTGASAFQFVPEIAPKVAALTVFQRTPPWLAPSASYHAKVPQGVKWLIEHAPFYGKWYRFFLFWLLTDGVYDAVKGDDDWEKGGETIGQANADLRAALVEIYGAQLEGRPDLLAKAVPHYPYGGKRPLVDNGSWFDALKRDNVDLIDTGIEKIIPAGVVTKDGRTHAADVLIYGTGFHASRFLWPMKIVGKGGAELAQVWNGDPRAYLGMTTPGFPNFFMIYGPNTNIVINGSIIFFSECSVRYIVGCLKLLAQTGAKAMEVKREVHDAFNRKVDAANLKMAWGAPNVNSWYKNAAGRVTQNWPFPIVDYWTATVEPNPADFVLTAKETADA